MAISTKQCVILAGGYGSRLKNFTKKIPKPLLKFQQKPFLLHLIESLSQKGIEEFLIFTFYKSSSFKKKIFKNYNVKILKEEKKLGTGGGLIKFKRHLKNSFFLVNGDTFFDIDIKDFEFEVKKNKTNLGVALTKNNIKKNNLNYKINKKNFVTDLCILKNTKLISGGIYYFKKQILNKFSKIKNLDLDSQIIQPYFLKNKITAKYYKDRFIDFGNIKTLKYLQKNFEKFYFNKCCFLDRDGVINEDYGYVHKIKDFKWRKNIFKAIKLLNKKNYFVIIITNQAGIAKGIFNLEQYYKLTNFYLNKIKKSNGKIDKIFECFDHPDGVIKKFKKNSFMRKPNPGMILKACAEFKIDKKKSFFVGDKKKDFMAAKKAGVKFYYVKQDLYAQIKQITK